MKDVVDKLDFIKKIFCSAKDKVKRRKRQVTDQEEIFAKTYIINDCYSEYNKNLYYSTKCR